RRVRGSGGGGAARAGGEQQHRARVHQAAVLSARRTPVRRGPPPRGGCQCDQPHDARLPRGPRSISRETSMTRFFVHKAWLGGAGLVTGLLGMAMAQRWLVGVAVALLAV